MTVFLWILLGGVAMSAIALVGSITLVWARSMRSQRSATEMPLVNAVVEWPLWG